MRTRKTTSIAFQQSWDTQTGISGVQKSGLDLLSNSSIITDEEHTGWGNPRLRGMDTGGMMDLSSITYLVSPVDISWRHDYPPNYGWKSGWAHGKIYPTGLTYRRPYSDFISQEPSETRLGSLGTTAIARTSPTKPLVQFSVDVGETVMGGLPAVVGLSALPSKTKSLMGLNHPKSGSRSQKAGSEFLNVEFGWLPLVSDLRKLATSVKESNKLIRQYHKSSGEQIRRGYTFPSTDVNLVLKPEDTTPTDWFVPNQLSLSGSSNLYTGVSSFHGTIRTWFSGAFKYHIPLGNDLVSKMERWESDANRLLGSRLTPSVVWELAPWSWAADWFGNMGDVMANVSNLGADGLVLEYGYIMSSCVTRHDMTMKVPMANFYGRGSSIQYATTSVETKHLRRRRSTPYGFGFDMKTLSGAQDAVLVALALSHGQR